MTGRKIEQQQSGQSLTHSGGFINFHFTKINIDPELRGRTRRTSHWRIQRRCGRQHGWQLFQQWYEVHHSGQRQWQVQSELCTVLQRRLVDQSVTIWLITQMCSGTSWLIFSCGWARLNGQYYTEPKGAPSTSHGIKWYHWLGWDYSLKSTTMKILKKD